MGRFKIIILITFPILGIGQEKSNFEKLKGVWFNEYIENIFVCYSDSLEYMITVEYDEYEVYSEKISFTKNYDFSERVIESESTHGDFIIYGGEYPKVMKLTFDHLDQDKFQLFRPWPNENLFFCRLKNPSQKILTAFSNAGCLRE